MNVYELNRQAVVNYAKEWAFKRNPNYLDFENFGGDCTNFVSQCIYAGCGVMNYTHDSGWYYNSPSDRAAGWSSVKYLYKFLTLNKDVGPYAVETGRDGVEIGDIVQLSNRVYGFHHSLIIVDRTDTQIYIASHSFDAFMRPLDSYFGEDKRYLHIEGYNKR